jgi:hypothetical protein
MFKIVNKVNVPLFLSLIIFVSSVVLLRVTLVIGATPTIRFRNLRRLFDVLSRESRLSPSGSEAEQIDTWMAIRHLVPIL